MIFCLSFHFSVSDNKAEIKAAIWRIPPVDETEPPPPDSPGLSHSCGGGYTRPLQLVCQLDNQNENMKRSEELKGSSYWNIKKTWPHYPPHNNDSFLYIVHTHSGMGSLESTI